MRSLRIQDVVTLTALTALVAVPAALVLAEGQHEMNSRITCARNLTQIGRALILYSNENRGKYPRTMYKQDAKLVWGTPYATDKAAKANPNADPFDPAKQAPAVNDVTAPLYLLIRNEDLTPDVFVCPSSNLKPWDFGGTTQTAMSFTNWLGNDGLAQHLSYSYANPYPAATALMNGYKLDDTLSAEFAVVADMNPGSAAVTTVAKTDTADKVRAANSLNHNGDGQNVLFGDGHVEFETSPFVGVQRDNIYTANGPEVDGRANAKARLDESPADAGDSVLVPTASDIGQKIAPMDAAAIAKADAADAAAAADVLKRANGTWWHATGNGRVERLTIADGSFTVVNGASTIRLDARFAGSLVGGAVVSLSKSGGQPSLARLAIDEDGKLAIDLRDQDPAMIRGEWQRGTGPAASRPANGRSPTSMPTSRSYR